MVNIYCMVYIFRYSTCIPPDDFIEPLPVRQARLKGAACDESKEHLASFREHLASFREHLASFRQHLASFREHLASSTTWRGFRCSPVRTFRSHLSLLFREHLASFREHLASFSEYLASVGVMPRQMLHLEVREHLATFKEHLASFREHLASFR